MTPCWPVCLFYLNTSCSGKPKLPQVLPAEPRLVALMEQGSDMLGLDQVAVTHQSWDITVPNEVGVLSLKARKLGEDLLYED